LRILDSPPSALGPVAIGRSTPLVVSTTDFLGLLSGEGLAGRVGGDVDDSQIDPITCDGSIGPASGIAIVQSRNHLPRR
jgi:hypothetical protein